jgi:hypothetical protein
VYARPYPSLHLVEPPLPVAVEGNHFSPYKNTLANAWQTHHIVLTIVNYKKTRDLSSSISVFGVLQKLAMFWNKSTEIPAPSNSRVSAMLQCCFDYIFSDKCMQIILINMMFFYSEGRKTLIFFLYFYIYLADFMTAHQITEKPLNQSPEHSG